MAPPPLSYATVARPPKPTSPVYTNGVSSRPAPGPPLPVWPTLAESQAATASPPPPVAKREKAKRALSTPLPSETTRQEPLEVPAGGPSKAGKADETAPPSRKEEQPTLVRVTDTWLPQAGGGSDVTPGGEMDALEGSLEEETATNGAEEEDGSLLLPWRETTPAPEAPTRVQSAPVDVLNRRTSPANSSAETTPTAQPSATSPPIPSRASGPVPPTFAPYLSSSSESSGPIVADAMPRAFPPPARVLPWISPASLTPSPDLSTMSSIMSTPSLPSTSTIPSPPISPPRAPMSPGYPLKTTDSLVDRFAPIYYPAWIKAVNTSMPSRVFRRPPADSLTHKYQELHEHIFPRRYLYECDLEEAETRQRIDRQAMKINPVPPLEPPFAPPAPPSRRIIPQNPATRTARLESESSGVKEIQPLKTPDVLDGLPELAPESYAAYWTPVQRVELNARILQLRDASLYGVALSPRLPDPGDPMKGSTYVLQARSVREGWPPVDLGDLVELRQLRPDAKSWQGIHFEGTVAGISRASGELLIRTDEIFLRWRHSTETVDRFLQHHLSGSPPIKSSVLAWLFPEPEDLPAGPASEPTEPYLWKDSALNEEQRNAVESIVAGRDCVPFLLWGPPGTGKTKTLVEAVLQILDRCPTTHVLVAGASASSADTLAERLIKFLSPNELFRLNSPGRPFNEIQNRLLPYCHSEDDKFSLPSLPILLAKRVIVTTCDDAYLLLRARTTNHHLSSLEQMVMGAIHPSTPRASVVPHFSHLLVDEAAQATEADLVCALAVVATSDDRCLRAHVTICGDAKQLGPLIRRETSRAADLDVSLLERLSERPVYRDHPCSRRNRRKHDVKWVHGTPFVDLTKNYRSATPILMLPSILFYHDSLEPCASEKVQRSPLHLWDKLPQPGFPILFHGLCGQDEPVDEGASFWNRQEVNYVVEVIQSLVGKRGFVNRHGVVHPRDISVISPFREQVWKIRLALRNVGLGDVDVGNVEALQGKENRVMVISTVRSTERWLKLDRALSRGLIHEPKRWNVALTRAKELMVVVGNPVLLTCDPSWKAFYRFCKRWRALTGERVEDNSPTAGAEAISRLEEKWVQSADLEATFDRLVGHIVRETLTVGEED